MNFTRYFFKYEDCEFLFTTLAQVNRSIEGCCPSCGSDDLDYAPCTEREQYVRDLLDELEYIRDEELNEECL